MSFAALIRRLAGEIATLVGEEFALARAEMTAKIRSIVIGLALFVVALVFLVVVAFTATTTAILALSLVVAPWLAALIVTGVALVIVVVCALAGRASLGRAMPLAPTTTLASVKENVAWAKRLTRSR